MILKHLSLAPSQNYKPPLDSNHQDLPLKEMIWEDFEKLCLKLVEEYSGFSISDCEIYGSKGQKQEGIDIFARNEENFQTFQCKRYQTISPSKLDIILKEFEDGEWFSKCEKFTLCITVDFDDVKLQNKFEQIKKYYHSKGKIIEKWDFSSLNRILKNFPEIVYDFFGTEWCKKFCGEEIYENVISEFNYDEYQIKLKKASSFLSTIKNHFEKKHLSHIERKQTIEIFHWINNELLFSKRNLLVVEGEKGIGKSVILKDLYEKLINKDYDVLAIKADKYYASNPKELENKLFFNDDITFSKIIKFINKRSKKLVVIIDQLDALSLTLSSNREYLQTYNRLINELLDEKNIRIIISSRSFDLNYDADLSVYKSDKFANVKIDELSKDEVIGTFKLFNVNCSSEKVINLLRTPNHLEIFCKLPNKSKIDVDSLLTIKDLYDNLWIELISDNVKQKKFLYEISLEMYRNQKISVLNKYHEKYKSEVSYLKSNQLIIESGNEIQFFHQTFYEYCFARQFVENGLFLKHFITENEQSLYVRSVIKMVIEYLREYNLENYLNTIREILNSPIFRFHVKSLIITNIALQENPTQKEIHLVEEIILSNKMFEEVFAFSCNSKNWISFLIREQYFTKFLILKENYGNRMYNMWHKMKLPENIFIKNYSYSFKKDNNIGVAYRLIGGKINISPIEMLKFLDELKDFEEKNNFIGRILINVDNWENKDLIFYFEKYIKYFDEGNKRDNFWYYQILQKIFSNNKIYVLEKLKPILYNLFKDGPFQNEIIHDIESILEELYKLEPELTFKLIFEVFYSVIEENKSFEENKNISSKLYSCTKFYDKYTSVKNADMIFEEYITKYLKIKLADRESFLVFFNEYKNSSSVIILRILIVTLSTSYNNYKDEIFEIINIIYDKMGFNEVDNILQLELRKLIGLVFSLYPIKSKNKIIEILLSIRHPYEIGFHRYKDGNGNDKVYFTGFGKKQLKFIKQIPIAEINNFPNLKRRYNELYRKFGNIDSDKASDVSSFTTRGVGSPLFKKEYENMSFDGWKRSMLKFNDTFIGEWASGGKREHSQEFKSMVQKKPSIFFNFIEQLFETEGISIDYLYSGIDGLIEARFNPIQVKELFKKLLQCNLTREYSLYAIWKSEYFINEKVLDVEIFNFLCDCSLNHIDPKIDSELKNDELHESANSVRGAAIQKVILCYEYHEFENEIFETVEKAIYDERFSIKVAVMQKLAFLNNLNLERSFKIFNSLIENNYNSKLLKYSFWSSQYFNNVFHKRMKNYFESIIANEDLHNEAFIIIQNWIDEKINDKNTFKRFISSSKSAKLCAIRVAEGNLFHTNEEEMNNRCIKILKIFLNEKHEDFASAYSGLILRKFKPEHFKVLYPFLKLYSKRELCRKEPAYFLQFLLSCSKDYPVECLQLAKNMNFNKNSRINENGYYYDKEPVKLILAIYSKLNMDFENNRKYINQSLNVFDSMLTHSHLRNSANSAIDLII